MIIEGVKARVEGGYCSTNNSDKEIVINNLMPGVKYNVKVDQKSFENPLWVPKFTEFGFVPEPNSYKSIDVPCYSTAVLEGTIRRFDGLQESAQDRVKIHIVSKDGTYHETVPVFSDGSFYKIGVRSGDYIAYVDSLQCRLLDAESVPPIREFQIKVSDEGEEVSALDFTLNLTSQIEKNQRIKDEQKNPVVQKQPTVDKLEEAGTVHKIKSAQEKETKPVQPVKVASAPAALPTEKTILYKTAMETNITPEIRKYLDSVVTFINDHPESKIQLTGYTDSYSTADINMSISLKRAQSAAAYMKSKHA